jgi:hypothetical protein
MRHEKSKRAKFRLFCVFFFFFRLKQAELDEIEKRVFVPKKKFQTTAV